MLNVSQLGQMADSSFMVDICQTGQIGYDLAHVAAWEPHNANNVCHVLCK